MEKFDLSVWLQDRSRKVVTRDGRPVRIVCWDRKTTYWKIVGLVTSPDGSTENPFTYDVNGNESDGCLHDHKNDLFFADEEEELIEFDKGLLSAFNSVAGKAVTTIGIASFQEDVDEWSKPLFNLARKELEKEDWRTPLRAYKNAYEQGKQDFMEKACDWLSKQPMSRPMFWTVEDFKNYMQDE